MGHLLSQILSFANLDLNCFVRDLTNLDGSWNLDLIPIWLTEEVINRIVSIPPPDLDSGSDMMIWTCLTRNTFSV